MNRTSSSAREGTRSFGDAEGATRLERWVVVLLVPVGVALGHVGVYRLVYQDHGVRHAALTGHGYFRSFGVAASVCGIAALLRAVLCERRRRTHQVSVGVLAAMQVAAFTVLEVGEGVRAGQAVPGALSEPAVWVGLVAQLYVAVLLALSVRWMAPLLADLAPSAPALCVLPSACVPLRCTAPARRGTRPGPSPRTLRGPPRLTAA